MSITEKIIRDVEKKFADQATAARMEKMNARLMAQASGQEVTQAAIDAMTGHALRQVCTDLFDSYLDRLTDDDVRALIKLMQEADAALTASAKTTKFAATFGYLTRRIV